MIAGRQPHHDDVLGVVLVLVRVDEVYDLVVDDTGVRIVDSTMSTNQELGHLLLIGNFAGRLQQLAETLVRVDHVGDTLGGIKPSDLDDVVANRPLELVHLFLDTQAAELVHVELRVPWAEVLIKTIKPVR